MHVAVVWIDSQRAHLFHLSEERMERVSLAASRQLFDEIAHDLERAEHVIIVGPGSERTQLRDAIVRDHPTVGRRIAGCEPASASIKDAEIAEFALKFAGK